MIVIISKSQKSSFQVYLVIVFNTFCFSDFTAVTTTAQERDSPMLLNVDPTAYDLIMPPRLCLPLTLPHPEPEPVCKMQTPAFFTMAQSSPDPQSVDTMNYARMSPLPSHATSSSS